MKAIITTDYFAKLENRPEVVETVDISYCVNYLKQLKELADIVNSKPESFCDAAKAMAFMIQTIYKSISDSK